MHRFNPVLLEHAETVAAPDAGAEGRGFTVLVCEPHELLASSLRRVLTDAGYAVHVATSGEDARDVARRQHPDIVLTERTLPDMDGLALLGDIKALAPGPLVVVTDGFGDADRSVEAIRAGAYDYFPKPFTAAQLRARVGRAAERARLARDLAAARELSDREYSFDTLVGTGEAFLAALGAARRAAPGDAGVLVWGERGTGKDHVARAIHAESRRSVRPFVAIACGSLPDFVLEAELFGAAPGFFNGPPRRALLEVACGGTFFLDEVTGMSLEMQARLLRAVRERRIRPVGGDEEVPIDVRWIASTRRDPDQAVRDGVLRRDLRDELGTVSVALPPLRGRREDISELARHFLLRSAREHARWDFRLGPEALTALMDHGWPGNVRELRDVAERVVRACPPGQEMDGDAVRRILFGHGRGSPGDG